MSVVTMLAPLRCCKYMKIVNHGFFSLGNTFNPASKAHYSKDNDSCSKDVSQTEGKKAEPWPKLDPPPPAWRVECPKDPQPPNYDPYRIKVPDVVVPPLPPSNAKRGEVVLSTTEQDREGPDSSDHDDEAKHIQKQPGHPATPAQTPPEEPKTEGLMGLLRGLFDRLKGKSKGGGDAMMTGQDSHTLQYTKPEGTKKPMLECARTRGPCSSQAAPPPPPCPPPTPKPFPWMYVWLLASFCSIVGVVYKFYVWKEEKDKQGDYRPIWRPRRKTKRPYHDKDLPACVQYLIVGAGAAGWAAYRAIMHHNKKAKVFFITKEDCLPYIQPPMSKFMWWNPDPPDLKSLGYIEEGRRRTMYLSECDNFLDPVKFYRKKSGPAVSIATGWCVVRVDADQHVVYVKTMCGEQPIYYERCLLAPGSKAKIHSVFKSAPKGVRDRVTSIRTIRDLEMAYRKVKAAKHVVIIGGGPLGCELAWHLGKMNQLVERTDGEDPIQFVHMFKDKGIMAGVLPEYLGEWATEKIKCESVTVMPKTVVYDAFETADGRLQLTLSDGSSLVTDYVLVGIGAEPRVDLAEPSFLEQDYVNGGFKVNTELEARTHLYVAGDAASYYSQWHGTRMRTDHYDNAEEQGFVAGANMTGYWLPCNMEPHYWLKLGHDLEMQVVGEVGACLPTVGLFKQCANEPELKTQVVEAGGGDRPCYKKSEEYQNRYKRGIIFYLRDETVVGMVFWNLPPIDDRKEVVTEMLRARPSYKDINMLAELLGFPDTRCTYTPDEQRKDPGPCVTNWRVF